MAIYNKGTIKPRPLAGTAASSAQQLATQVAQKQASGPIPNGPLDTTGRQSIRGPASGPLTAPTSLPNSGGPISPYDPRGQPPPDLKGVTLPRPGAVQGDTSTLNDVRNPVGPRQPPAGNQNTTGLKDVTLPSSGGQKVLTGGFVGTPPPINVQGGKVVAPTPQTEEQLVDAAVRKLLEDQSANTEKERAAMQGEMKVAEARDIQSMRARTGLGGMGLTGAAGAMESQVRTEGARKQALTTADFNRKARQEEMARTIAGIEAKFGKDAADRARESFGIEKSLLKDEFGVLRTDFPEGPEGDKAYEDAKKAFEDANKVKDSQSAADKDTTAAETIKNASQAEFEAMRETDLVKAGWTLDDTRRVSEDGKRYYYNWTSPDGKTKRRAYIDKDDWAGQEHHSGGVEW